MLGIIRSDSTAPLEAFIEDRYMILAVIAFPTSVYLCSLKC